MFRSEELVFIVLVTVYLFFMECTADTKLSENMAKSKAVKDRILTGYDRTIRPTLEGSNTTEITTALIPRQILNVDEEKGLFVLDSYYVMRWVDPRLKWNATTDYNGDLILPIEMLWVPDISVYNSHSINVKPTKGDGIHLHIQSSGTVLWVPPIQTKTSCPALTEARDLDQEITCKIRLGSWVHDGWEIDFSHSDNLSMTEFVNINSRWELQVSKTIIVRNITYYKGYNEPYLSLDVYFPIRRRPVPEIEATRKPCNLIMLLTLSIFWFPPNSSKKVLLGGMLFLALIIMLIYVANNIRYPLTVTLAVPFLQYTLYILVTTILLQVLVIYNLCKLSGQSRPPPAAMQLLTGSFGKYTCLRWPTTNDSSIDRVQLKEDYLGAPGSPSPHDDWMLFAAGLDRLLFVLMSIAMLTVHNL